MDARALPESSQVPRVYQAICDEGRLGMVQRGKATVARLSNVFDGNPSPEKKCDYDCY
jgi:hypothetical protein